MALPDTYTTAQKKKRDIAFDQPVLGGTSLSPNPKTSGTIVAPKGQVGTTLNSGIDFGNEMAGGGPIVAPPRTTTAEAFKSIQPLLPQFTPITAPTLSNLDTSGIDRLQSFDDSYYQNLSDQASKALNKKYFTDNNSILDQRENQIKHRGLFGSGVGEAATGDVYKDFGNEMATIESNLTTQKAQDQRDIAEKNRDLDIKALLANSDISKFNIGNLLDVGKYNADTKNSLTELGLRSAADEAKTGSDYSWNVFKSEVDNQSNDKADLAKQRQSLIDLINSPNVDRRDKDRYAQMLSDLFGNTFGDNGVVSQGTSSSQSQQIQQKPQPPSQDEAASLGPPIEGAIKRSSNGTFYQGVRNPMNNRFVIWQSV